MKSISFPEKISVGYTNNLSKGLDIHNEGKSIYTAKYKPWKFHGYMAFEEESKAIAFEKYLKSGSGKAFVKNHF